MFLKLMTHKAAVASDVASVVVGKETSPRSWIRRLPSLLNRTNLVLTESDISYLYWMGQFSSLLNGTVLVLTIWNSSRHWMEQFGRYWIEFTELNSSPYWMEVFVVTEWDSCRLCWVGQFWSLCSNGTAAAFTEWDRCRLYWIGQFCCNWMERVFLTTTE